MMGLGRMPKFIMIMALALVATWTSLYAKPTAAQSTQKSKVAKKFKLQPKSKTLNELKLVEGDERGNEVKALKAEMLVSKTENQAIEQAKKLLKKYKGTPMEPEIQFRLAEMYMRKSKTDRFFEVHRQSDTVVSLAPRLLKEASSRESIQAAVQTYSAIQSRFSDFQQMDLVIFNHAFARQALGQEKDSENLYQELINRFPNSPLVPDAHLAIGEIAFGANQFVVALDHFNAIRKYPESRVYPYGLYKAAWTHYNMRDAEKGLRKLEEVVAYGKFAAQSKLESRLDLRKEALNDMTLFYEDVFPSKDAYKYFVEQAGIEEVGPILLRMATLYERHSRFNDQRVVLQLFMEKLPSSPLLPKVTTDLVLAFDHLRQKDQAVTHLAKFVDTCKENSKWKKAQEGKKEIECLSMLNETALRLAKKWLKAWKKLPSDITYADASEKAFAIYLATPSANEEYAQSNYAYAELLFARGKYREASSEYARVGQTPKASSLTHDASYGAIVSLEKAVGDKWSGSDEKNFHQLASDYLTKNPKGQYRLDVEYKMALLAYERERYDEAAPQFLRIGREYPLQEKGQKAQDLYLDILNIKKDYKGIRHYTQELMKSGGDGMREAKLRRLYEQSYFLQVQALEESGQNEVALSEYLAFAKQNPGSELVEKALWNAMQLQYKLGDALNGSRTAEEFTNKYPKSPQATNALLRAAHSYEQMAQLSEAARVLEKLSGRDAKNATRWRELAADFFALDGQMPQARKLYAELKPGVEGEARVQLLNKIEIMERNYGTDSTRAESLRALVDANIQPHSGLAKVQQVETLFNRNQHTEAFNEARRYLGSGLPNDLKARLRLVQAKVLEQEFIKQSVKSRAERVATVLAIKTEKLQKAQEALQSAIKYGHPRTSLDAFERLYGCYNHYVTALKEMPTPAGLSDADAQAFRAELDNLVVPLEEKSVDTLAQAVQFAHKQSFLDGSASRLEAQLAVLNKQNVVQVAPKLNRPEPVVPLIAGVGP